MSAALVTPCALCAGALDEATYRLAGPAGVGAFAAVLHKVCPRCAARLERDPAARRILTLRSRNIVGLLDAPALGAA